MCIIFSPVCNGRCWAKIKKGTDCQYFFHCEVLLLIFLTPCQWFSNFESKGWWDQDTRRICCTLSKWMWRLRSQLSTGCGEDKSYGYGAPWYQNNGDIKTTVISKQRWYQNNGDIKTTVNHRRWYQNTKAENFSSTKFQFWQVGLKSLFNCFNIPTNTPLEHSGIIQIALFAQNVVICKLASRYWWLIDFPPAMFVLCTRFRCSRCLALFWNILSNYVGRGWGMRGWSPQQGNFPCPPFGEV